MKPLSFLIASLFVSTFLFAQDKEKEKKDEGGYKFTMVKQVKATPVKDQNRSGTCWSFSSLAFVESELIRNGKEEVDLSEMFVVRCAYIDRAERYVRLHGKMNFGSGAENHDAFNAIKKYGIVPEEAYPGLCYGEEKHVHSELDAVLKGFLDALIKDNDKLTPAWKVAYNGILDAYLGKVPDKFNYKGKSYDPKSFAKDFCGINPDDYIELTSFTHQPFYEKFILELPDNWSLGMVYNLPLNEFSQVFDYAIDNGFSIAWASDVSEKGFSWKNGVAIVPDKEKADIKGLERAKWDDLTNSEKNELLYSFKKPIPEKKITPELRQEGFDNFQSQDDHGMQITGIAKDQLDTKYYFVKNSWGTVGGSPYNGYFYASEPFVLYKTISIMVHKNAIPKDILKKLKL